MKFYIHKDIFYPDAWSRKFEWVLDNKIKVPYTVTNFHFNNNINDLQIGNDDWCICRFGHYEEDFELSKRVYPLLHEKFNEKLVVGCEIITSLALLTDMSISDISL